MKVFLSQVRRKEHADRLQKANHIVAGLEIDLGKNVELNIEPYLKDFSQLINLNRNKLTASRLRLCGRNRGSLWC